MTSVRLSALLSLCLASAPSATHSTSPTTAAFVGRRRFSASAAAGPAGRTLKSKSATTCLKQSQGADDVEEVDVAIVGAGIGGLCAGAILNTLYNKKVCCALLVLVQVLFAKSVVHGLVLNTIFIPPLP